MKWVATVFQSLFIALFAYTVIFVFLAYKVEWPHRFIVDANKDGKTWLYIADKCVSITFIYFWPPLMAWSIFGWQKAWKASKYFVGLNILMGVVWTSIYETILLNYYLNHHSYITLPVYLYYGVETHWIGHNLAKNAEDKLRFHLFFTIPMVAAGACAWLYDIVLFTWIWFLTNDTYVVMFRLLAHPATMEGVLFVLRFLHRRVYKSGQFVFIMYVQWILMNALYGRLLIVRIISTENVFWTLIVVMITEIFIRATTKERDRLFRISATVSNNNEMTRLRSDILSLELIIEFFAIIFVPTATYLYGVDPRSVDEIIFAILIQLAIEIITALICVFVDHYRGLSTSDHWEDRDEKHDGLVMVHIFMGVIYTLFSLSFYIVTIKKLR